MKIAVESTTRIVDIGNGIECRVWEGATEAGIKIIALIPRVMVVEEAADISQFEAELKEEKAPSAVAQSIPLRLIL